ncbi:hypothetical protein ACOSZF_24085 [Cytobacillus firmus]|uniref:hypothetical protein n=1 Tax=Cytobacillus firmus TaxID=1399 RepID=UPI00237BAD4E|nr:hypothetical protein [Cytobacillus firmus]MDD9314198.1 hypothetical protein [Cytobacillus firmus]
MANQIDTNKLKQAEAASSIVKDMITSAIEQSAANTTLASEALKQASNEFYFGYFVFHETICDC